MKRYYSHYTYIYPNTYLKDSVVELDNTNNIVKIFPFEKELEKTEFSSGVLFFVPNSMRINPYFVDYTKKQLFTALGEEVQEDVEVNAVICNVED